MGPRSKTGRDFIFTIVESIIEHPLESKIATVKIVVSKGLTVGLAEVSLKSIVSPSKFVIGDQE